MPAKAMRACRVGAATVAAQIHDEAVGIGKFIHRCSELVGHEEGLREAGNLQVADVGVHAIDPHHATGCRVAHDHARDDVVLLLLFRLRGSYRAFRGKASASEAAAAVLNHAFEDRREPKIRALIDSGNESSRCVAERLGMAYEAKSEFNGKEINRYLRERS